MKSRMKNEESGALSAVSAESNVTNRPTNGQMSKACHSTSTNTNSIKLKANL